MGRHAMGLALGSVLILACGSSSGERAEAPASGTSCGDPAVAARFEPCMDAEDRQSCEAAGGDWTRIGPAPFESCQCPTGQADCPCTTSDDCLGACMAPLPGGPGDFDCSSVTSGTCAGVGVPAGCACFLSATRGPQGLCAN